MIDRSSVEFYSHLKQTRRDRVKYVQIELTKRCPINCRHCYIGDVKDRKVSCDVDVDVFKKIVEMVYDEQILTVVLSGGDPLIHPSFAEMYRSLKTRGFIVQVMSSLAALEDDVVGLFGRMPPYFVQTSINAASRKTYREITGCDMFDTQLENIRTLKDAGVRVKCVTVATRDNIKELDSIKDLVEGLGMEFNLGLYLFPRLNGCCDTLKHRISARDFVRLMEKYEVVKDYRKRRHELEEKTAGSFDREKLFNCLAGREKFDITCDGKMIVCNMLRKPAYDLLGEGASIMEGLKFLGENVLDVEMPSSSRCFECSHRVYCLWCPARAYLETGGWENHVPYICELFTHEPGLTF